MTRIESRFSVATLVEVYVIELSGDAFGVVRQHSISI